MVRIGADMEENKPKNKMKTWQKVLVGCCFLFFAIVFIAVLASSNKQEADENSGISQEMISDYCTNANITGKYIPDYIKTVKIGGSPSQSGDFEGWYDRDKNMIKYYRWSGENKNTDKEVRFDCWVSGTDKDKLTLHRLSVDGNDLFNTTSLTVFDEHGNRIFAD